VILAQRPRIKIAVHVTAAFVVSLVAVVGLGLALQQAFVANGATPFDARVTKWFVNHRTETLTSWMRALTWLGSTAVIVPVALVVITALLVEHRVLLSVFLTVAVAGASLLSILAKQIVGRDRPPAPLRLASVTSSSFPSGHATQAAATYLALAVIASLFVRQAWTRIAVWGTAIVIVAAVGASRVYLGVHWATDVLGGWFLGAVWVAGLTLAFRPTGGQES